MIIVLLLLFQSLCLYCQRLVLYIHDLCFPRNARLLQEVAETVGDRRALQHLQQQQQEQTKRQHKRRLLEPILPLGAGQNLEACRFCAHSPQGYCRHHFHLQELQLQRHQRQQQRPVAGQEYRQLRRIKRELKQSLSCPKRYSYQPPRASYQQDQEQQQQQAELAQEQVELPSSHSSLTSGYFTDSQSTTPPDTPTYFEPEPIEQLQQSPAASNIVTSYL